MKKLRITLNEQVYEVQVEILEDDEGRASGVPAPTKGYAVAKVQAPRAQAIPAAPRAASRAPQAPDAGSLNAPIVGSVSQILVEVGTTVEENQPVVVLDAMKMDTYINATRAATVSAIHCQVGQAVQVGQKLVSFA